MKFSMIYSPLVMPTELLAEQHYKTLQAFAQSMNITIALVMGATKKKQCNEILNALQAGKLQIIVGTHALHSDTVNFNNLSNWRQQVYLPEVVPRPMNVG